MLSEPAGPDPDSGPHCFERGPANRGIHDSPCPRRMDVENATRRRPQIMELIASAPWREAVTFRDTWPHEYVVVNRDGQRELLAAFCERIGRGEGVECRFFHQRRQYLFLGGYKYWIMTECSAIDLDAGDAVLNRALLYGDRRDFVIQPGDTGKREDYPASPAHSRRGSSAGA